MNPANIELSLQWGAAVVITISISGLVIIYRHQLLDLIKKNIKRIKIGFFEIELDKQRLDKVRKQIDISQGSATDQGTVSKQRTSESADLSARDIVLNQWGSLKQVVNDIAIGRQFRLTPASKTPDVIKRLLGAQLIKPDLAEAVNFLFEEGKKVSENAGKVDREYALMYEEISGSLVDWMMLNILSPEKVLTTNQKKVVERRQTIVGESAPDFSFTPPRPGNPVAWLVGKGGRFQGRRFPIEKEQYRIGRNSDNDLCLEEDDYVSGKHAYLKYMESNLFLYDLNSRNGTFVNDRKIKGSPCAVHKGDHLKFGVSVFEVL
jgi:pSer/pThr/pTyr-binding forkhead associated (FHA) protein